MSNDDDKSQRIAGEVSKLLTRALAGIDIYSFGAAHDRPEPRFSARRPSKPRNPARPDLPGQLRFPFADEVQE